MRFSNCWRDENWKRNGIRREKTCTFPQIFLCSAVARICFWLDGEKWGTWIMKEIFPLFLSFVRLWFCSLRRLLSVDCILLLPTPHNSRLVNNLSHERNYSWKSIFQHFAICILTVFICSKLSSLPLNFSSILSYREREAWLSRWNVDDDVMFELPSSPQANQNGTVREKRWDRFQGKKKKNKAKSSSLSTLAESYSD